MPEKGTSSIFSLIECIDDVGSIDESANPAAIKHSGGGRRKEGPTNNKVTDETC